MLFDLSLVVLNLHSHFIQTPQIKSCYLQSKTFRQKLFDMGATPSSAKYVNPFIHLHRFDEEIPPLRSAERCWCLMKLMGGMAGGWLLLGPVGVLGLIGLGLGICVLD